MDIPIKMSRTQQNLQSSRSRDSHGCHGCIVQCASLQFVQFNSTESYDIRMQIINRKKYLHILTPYEFKHTEWMVEKTKDKRYIWRATEAINQEHVFKLLLFILKFRENETLHNCPSILINTSTHGTEQGLNAYYKGEKLLSDQQIHEKVVSKVEQIIKDQSNQVKLNKQNSQQKIYINSVATTKKLEYPRNADHIIDTHCWGARRRVQAFEIQSEIKGQNCQESESKYPSKSLLQVLQVTKSESSIKEQEKLDPSQVYPKQHDLLFLQQP